MGTYLISNRGIIMNEIVNPQTTVSRTSRGVTIACTRLTIYHVMDYLKADWPPNLIQNWLNLTDKQIADVMAYIEVHRDEVETEYHEVLHLAEESYQYWEERNKERFAKIAAMPPKPGQETIMAKLKTWEKRLNMR